MLNNLCFPPILVHSKFGILFTHMKLLNKSSYRCCDCLSESLSSFHKCSLVGLLNSVAHVILVNKIGCRIYAA